MVLDEIQSDLPQSRIRVGSTAMRRFWTMLAHTHGQVWNASELGRSMGLSDKTVRGYLDELHQTFMVRQLQPWFENIGKRQIKSPKVYLHDCGLLHHLLGLGTAAKLQSHPKVGSSWEGFALEQVLRHTPPSGLFLGHAGRGRTRSPPPPRGAAGGIRVQVCRTAAPHPLDARRHGRPAARRPARDLPRLVPRPARPGRRGGGDRRLRREAGRRPENRRAPTGDQVG